MGKDDKNAPPEKGRAPLLSGSPFAVAKLRPVRSSIDIRLQFDPRTSLATTVAEEPIEMNSACGLTKSGQMIGFKLGSKFEMDLCLLRVVLSQISTGPNYDHKVNWIQDLGIGYGFNGKMWNKRKLSTWESEFFRALRLPLLDPDDVMAKIRKNEESDMPEERKAILFEAWMDYLQNRQHEEKEIHALILKGNNEAINTLARTAYTMEMVDQMRQCRHALSGEEMNIFIDTKECGPLDIDITLDLSIAGVLYRPDLM
jgi:hypothetical protein